MLSRFEHFSSLVSGAYRSIQKLERDEMIKYGYKGAFAQYLITMLHYPDGLTAARLCEVCDRDKAAVSRVVTEMEGKGLVRREGTGDRAYRAALYLTEEGERAAHFVCERAKVAVLKAGEGLSDEDRQMFYAALTLIATNLQAICKEGIPE